VNRGAGAIPRRANPEFRNMIDRLRPILLATAMAAAFPMHATAQADFIKGVYLSSEELCAQAKKDGLQTVIEAGNTLLTPRGIEGIEYNCDFVEVTKAARAPAWAVTAICQEPGYVFPDVLSLTEMSPTQYDLVSVKPADEESGVAGNSGSYFLCEGVEMP
jgi:hypothetical protein